jgi:hypothetical protein
MEHVASKLCTVYHLYAACFCCGTSTKASPATFKEAVYWKVQEAFVRVKQNGQCTQAV